MEKTYKDLNTLTEIAQAMDAGKVVEYYSARQKWFESKKEAIYTNTKYRTVEETELPEQGDEILVWHTKEVKKSKRKFVAFWKDKVVTEYDSGTDVCVWNHWKPIDKKPKEGWIHPDALAPVRDCSGLIHVFEVLEDE